jgi:hypothetical protein
MDDCLRPEELRLSHHCNTGPGMSALGHKRTFAPQQAMCALHPKATCAVQLGMSAMGQ